ncbi:hypothetical protein CEXT_617031 [Caerostris extrusa]|uniref:Maturase K n=1 Tax=Caerostris extrusa TaxID=172846 RepID=A0AAV4XQK4_CAEEX|nr:hypothetical protein CEXT_617031 [Caerostris extrusa]
MRRKVTHLEFQKYGFIGVIGRLTRELGSILLLPEKEHICSGQKKSYLFIWKLEDFLRFATVNSIQGFSLFSSFLWEKSPFWLRDCVVRYGNFLEILL